MDDKTSIERLSKLYHTDPGFFALATHSWIEAWILEHFPEIKRRGETYDQRKREASFKGYLDEFRQLIDLYPQEMAKWYKGREVLKVITSAHSMTNDVRHKFANLSKGDAGDFLACLLTFMTCAGLDPQSIETLKQIRLTPPEDYAALYTHLLAQRKQEEEQLAVAEPSTAELVHLQEERDRLQSETVKMEEELSSMQSEMERIGHKAKNYDEVKRQMGEKKSQLLAMNQKLEHTQQRVNFFRTMVLHSRSRAIWERSLLVLNREQEEAAGSFRDQRVFLVKGPAGSGKTLVLLKCVERALTKAGQGELVDISNQKPLLMTWGRRVQAYTEFQIEVHSLFPADAVEMKTVDSWLNGLVRKDGSMTVDWQFTLPDLVQKLGTIEAMSLEQIADELNMIWERDVPSEEAYLSLERKGMRKALAAEKRAQVWKLHELLVEQSLASRVAPPALAWWLLLQRMRRGEGVLPKKLARVFVDECQDLTGTKLSILLLLSEHLVLAGDSEQMIYSGNSPFTNAGLDMRTVASAVLRQVWRNTVPIFTLGERLRSMLPDCAASDKGNATRMGPLPAVHEHAGYSSMQKFLVDRIRTLAFGSDPLYEPGSIVILTLADPDFLVQRLAEHSIPALSVKDETADFSKTDSVFVSTIHSAKGMDFPVVIVLLDDIDEMRGKYASQEYTAQDCYPRLLRLLYVAVTRAMDVLDICYFKASSGTGLAPELLALKRAHQEMVSSFEAIISG